MRLGVIVPCRNEALVIARRLRNLALCEWPASERPHRIVVVDDGSSDGTAGIARGELGRFDASRVHVEVLANSIRPGKSGAIAQGLVELGGEVELVVLTDADVVIASDALVALARAFEREARLGMATGSQLFVESLADDGTLRALDGGELAGANTLYDRGTALVRALESRAGLVFSVHGQLLAWRTRLELVPTPKLAADDLDLMLQVRSRGAPIRRLARARFCEVRAPKGDARKQQALRRARAYVQFLAHPRLGELVRRGGWLARIHAWLYLQLDATSHWTRVGFAMWLVVCVLAGWMAWGWSVALFALLVPLPFALVLWPVRRHIESAKALESVEPMSDHWETARR